MATYVTSAATSIVGGQEGFVMNPANGANAQALENTAYSMTYSAIKTYSTTTASVTDAFQLTSVTYGTLYYNAGSTSAPKYVQLSNTFLTNNQVIVRVGGLYINGGTLNGKALSGADTLLYWLPGGNTSTANAAADATTGLTTYNSLTTASNLFGQVSAFTVKAYDNADSTWFNGNDTVAADTSNVWINTSQVNQPPVFDTVTAGNQTTASIAENSTAKAIQVGVTDPDTTDTHSITLSGADASLFTTTLITDKGGVANWGIAFKSGADFEGAHGNTYSLTAKITDSAATPNSITENLTITVTDADDAAVLGGPAGTVTATNGSVAFSAAGANRITITDQDSKSATTAWADETVTVTSKNGTLTFTDTATAGTATINGSGTGTLTLSGKVSDVQTLLDNLTVNVNGQPDTVYVNAHTTTNNAVAATQLAVNISPGAPKVTSAVVDYNDGSTLTAATTTAHYDSTAKLDVLVTFDQAVTVVTTGGAPTMTLNLGAGTVTATYVSGSGSKVLDFQYQPGASDNGTLSVPANAAISVPATSSIASTFGVAVTNFSVAAPTTNSFIIDNVADASSDAAAAIGGFSASHVAGFINAADVAAGVTYDLTGVDSDANAKVTFHSTLACHRIPINVELSGTLIQRQAVLRRVQMNLRHRNTIIYNSLDEATIEILGVFGVYIPVKSL